MTNKKKTKIVCTVGPATNSVEKISGLLRAGMNLMRLNFSHGNHNTNKNYLHNFEIARKKTGISAAIIQDLCGPKIRIGSIKGGSTELLAGATFVVTTDSVLGDNSIVSINYQKFITEVKVGQVVLLQDGKFKLLINKISGKKVFCKVIYGGILRENVGVNLPESDLSINTPTKKDKNDVKFGLTHKVDFIALSFVRTAKDIENLKKLFVRSSYIPGIIAKIETPQAVKNIDEIIAVSDGIMIARGDLAIEIPAADVPLVQKMIIKKCNKAGKPVITATQILESMIESSVPSRAEVSDIANAILDGTDALMLSAETALGKHPVKAVEVMSSVASRVEGDFLHRQLLHSEHADGSVAIDESITASAVRTADRINAHSIASLTESGYSARIISRYRPHQLIYAFTPNKQTFQKLVLSFGVVPIITKRCSDVRPALELIRKFFLKSKLHKAGDKIVVTASIPFGQKIATNMLLVEVL